MGKGIELGLLWQGLDEPGGTMPGLEVRAVTKLKFIYTHACCTQHRQQTGEAGRSCVLGKL